MVVRRALAAGALIGLITGLVLIHRDSLRLTAVWPVILGFALWDTAGERGSHGIMAALAAGAGVAGAYLVFFIVSEFLPVTDLSLGIMSGVAVGVMVIVALLARGWIRVSAPLVGFAAFYGGFEPQWRQSPSTFLLPGLDDLRVFGHGAVTVVDPSGTQDVRNLLGYSGPSVQGGNLVYHLSNLEGSKQFLTVSTPEKQPPLAMAVQYSIDGRRISGQDLVGKSGDVQITFTVHNTTAKTMNVTYKDATGTTQSTD